MLVQPKTNRWSVDSAPAIPDFVPENAPQKVDDNIEGDQSKRFQEYGEVKFEKKKTSELELSQQLQGGWLSTLVEKTPHVV